MGRISVESSLVKSLGYDPSTSTLEVEFHNGSVYVYDGVPASVYEDIMASESVGKEFNRLVKREGAYPYTRM